jgi:hypothetical protein
MGRKLGVRGVAGRHDEDQTALAGNQVELVTSQMRLLAVHIPSPIRFVTADIRTEFALRNHDCLSRRSLR